jgi:tetratricopeptide (TPR) repeat protein
MYQQALRLAETAQRLAPDDNYVLATLGAALYFCGRSEQAAAEFKKALERSRKDPASYILPWYYCALLSLISGDLPAYRETCGDIGKRFSASKIAPDVRSAVWTCALAPEGVEAYPAVVELARRGIDLTPNGPRMLKEFGAILYRAGQLEEAVKQLTAAVKAPEDPFTTVTSSAYPVDTLTTVTYTDYFLAMTHHRLGHHDEARRWFDKAEQAMKKMLTEHKTETGESLLWNRRLTLELLHAEASAVLANTELLRVLPKEIAGTGTREGK